MSPSSNHRRPNPKRSPARPSPSRNREPVRKTIAILTSALICVLIIVVLGVTVRNAIRNSVVLPPDVSLAPNALRGVTVVIDPGHGGEDPGTVQAGITEASLTYRTAATLRAVVEQYGGRVVFTMKSSALVPVKNATSNPSLIKPTTAELLTRPGAIAKAGAESTSDLYGRADAGAKSWATNRPSVVFVSLHYDSSPDPSHRGGLVLIGLRTPGTPELATKLAERMRTAKLGGEIKRQQLGVLGSVHNPIPNRVLVELGTISNSADRRAAQDPQWRWRVARILTAAIADTTT